MKTEFVLSIIQLMVTTWLSWNKKCLCFMHLCMDINPLSTCLVKFHLNIDTLASLKIARLLQLLVIQELMLTYGK